MTTPARPADAIDRAVELVRSHWHVGMSVILTREYDPRAVPEYGETATIDGICRRIVGALLNEGWQQPSTSGTDQARGIALRLLAACETAGVNFEAVDRHLARAVREDPSLFWLRGEEMPPGEWRDTSGEKP